MTMQTGGYLARPAPSGLADVIEIVLDKGIVVDVYARVSLLGIELVSVDARIAVASADTYLRFAEATNRLDLYEHGGRTLPEMLEKGVHDTVEHVASNVVESKIEGAVEKVEDVAEKGGPIAEAVVSGAEKLAGKVVDALVPDKDEDAT
ncbi:hypothetical protein GCM10009798_07120 [Nocardioides panacihumi]|uniref:Gas vesicle protein A n=1 Tax=Nocardioides panacihumi TaxID=400774 RepID=A0ABN2QDW4_9ACTN